MVLAGFARMRKSRLIGLIAAFALSVMLLSVTAAQARTGAGHPAQAIGTAAGTYEGFLFVNGSYLPGPYKISCDGRILRINEAEFCEADFDLSQFQQAPESPAEAPIVSLAAALDSLNGRSDLFSSGPPADVLGWHARRP
jgi:hypothetical protein